MDGGETVKRDIVIRECPVCLRLVDMAVTVWTHKDTAGNPCPMSGRQAPSKWWQGIRAIPRERGDAA